MTDSEYVRLNTSLATASNSRNLHVDKRGQIEACIELRLPNEVITPSNGRLPKEVKLQTTKMRLSMNNTPIVDVPVTTVYSKADGTTWARTSCALSVWPFYVQPSGAIDPSSLPNDGRWIRTHPFFAFLEFNLIKMQEDPKIVQTEQVLHIRNIRWLEEALQDAFDFCFHTARQPASEFCQLKSRFKFEGDSFSITLSNATMTNTTRVALYGVPRTVRTYSDQNFGLAPGEFTNLTLDTNGDIVRDIANNPSGAYTLKFNLVFNSVLRNLLYFLPYLPPIKASSLLTQQTPVWVSGLSLVWTDDLYILDTIPTEYTESAPYVLQKYIAGSNPHWEYNVGKDQTLTWKNVPSVLLSPISSIVLLLDGVNVNGQVQPINIQQAQGSSLTTTIPVIENYSSLAANLRDLKDELVISRDAFTNNVLCSIVPSPGMMRDIRLRACYITKKGNLVPIYIPPEGEFSLQLSFLVKY